MTKDFGLNAGLVSELVGMYLHDRNSVDEQWRAYLDQLISGGDRHLSRVAATLPAPSTPTTSSPPPSLRFENAQELARAVKQAGVTQLIATYRARGHLLAKIDPLGLLQTEAPPAHSDFALETFGLSERDLDEEFSVADVPGPRTATLREIVARMQATYCRSIGVEFRDIEEPEQRRWLQEQMESTGNRMDLGRDLAFRILGKLTDAEAFETFIHKNFIGAKRFSVQGGESLIPMLDLLIDKAGELGAEEIVLGMAHRGRLNVLVNIMDKSVREIFAAFVDREPEKHLGSGDVKYHLGASTDRTTTSGKTVHLTLAFNPSHLEFVNPVVTGRVRAKQDRKKDRERRKVVPLLIHGDAAFMGQGVVAETLNLARLDGYCTGGTVHIIVNNQIGFTTVPRDSRSTRYATDLARMLRVPVFHVNGEDLEAVAHVARLAAEYRQKFGADVVIDLLCYRKFGHNEGDEPRFTQPTMYAAVDKKPSIREIFGQALVSANKASPGDVEQMMEASYKALTESLDYVKRSDVSWVPNAMGGVWIPFRGGKDSSTPEVATHVPGQTLLDLARKMAQTPSHFHPNAKVHAVWQERLKKLENGEGFDWGTGEAMAFATLLAQGTPIRLSGQDARRGTFTHRHAVLFDAKTGEKYSPYENLGSQQGKFEVWDSALSEQGVLGFDYGYSLDFPDALVIWEAQFGDFANGAQVIIDQFITSGEDKWRRLSGIVLLLPHGYEGAGPEHSSARLERFLQLAAEDNIQVCNLTTPAQIFHALRRQVLRPWRKPLVVMTPKGLLRAKQATSTIKDLTDAGFQRVIPDVTDLAPEKTRKLLLCSGKVYYDLADARKAKGADDVAIVRLEQLYPLDDALPKLLARYPRETHVTWVQEEPWNMGAWWYVDAHLGEMLRGRFAKVDCVARDESASPATGSNASHKLEQARLIERAFAG
jgi:2-oxoglutarate dehydrogenase E1 component